MRKRRDKEGKVIPGRYPKYGFRLAGDSYEVDAERIVLVRRVSSMVGEEGYSLRAVAKSLEQEQIPTPGGGKFWDGTLLGSWILDDAYNPHTYNEVVAFVSPEAAASLNSAGSYGLLWWGRRETKLRQISEPAANGERHYRKSYHCGANESHGRESCINNKNAVASPLERHAFEHARWLFSHPEELRAGLHRMIELERAGERGDSEAEKARWLKQLADIDAKSDRYQEQQAEGLTSLDKLREKLSGLPESLPDRPARA